MISDSVLMTMFICGTLLVSLYITIKKYDNE